MQKGSVLIAAHPRAPWGTVRALILYCWRRSIRVQLAFGREDQNFRFLRMLPLRPATGDATVEEFCFRSPTPPEVPEDGVPSEVRLEAHGALPAGDVLRTLLRLAAKGAERFDLWDVPVGPK